MLKIYPEVNCNVLLVQLLVYEKVTCILNSKIQILSLKILFALLFFNKALCLTNHRVIWM